MNTPKTAYRPLRFNAVVAGLSAGLTLSLSGAAHAQNWLEVDASAPAPAPTSGHLHMGTATSPKGETLLANSQYLSRNGQAWLPVMGEFHYSRCPAERWEAELRKMKAAGVDIVASYVIWNHHEEEAGQFNWQGQRDLGRFVRLAAKAGLKVVVRVGPWAHAEARFGGVPDWVVNSMPTRSSDPQYLKVVARLYEQIGLQLKGQMWKDGGPIIGIQLENEYNLTGPGQGEAHIRTLKQLARKAGLDAPLYTVTGWDGTVYPSGEVTPVFGGYPDEPWGVSTTELPPKETYAFRFDSRVSGDLGAQTAASAPGTAETDIALTPFLGAEYGAGLPAMYRRRTLVSPDDIASMLPVQLGSGVNLMGYYMFHGGRNPGGRMGRVSQEESTLSGGYNDTPMVSYDFNAPLGPDGQQRPVLNKLRPFHYFLHDFGAELAAMTVRKPALTPALATDLKTPRWSVRAKGDSGFLFFNNHVRQYAMPAQQQIRFSVKLATQTVQFPRQPIDVANGAYFIWPINFDLGGTRLSYATAQPVARLNRGREGLVYVFAAQAGIPVELAFADPAVGAHLQAPGARVSAAEGRLVIDHIEPGTQAQLTLQRPGAPKVTVLVLSPQQVDQLNIVDWAGERRLLLSEQAGSVAGKTLTLLSTLQPKVRVAVYPPIQAVPHSNLPLQTATQDGVFQVLEAQHPAVTVEARWNALRPAGEAPPVMKGGLAGAALQPIPEAFSKAAAWQIEWPQLPANAGQTLEDMLLQVDFVGDIGRLFAGAQLMDDWYYNGQLWQMSLKHLAGMNPPQGAQKSAAQALPLQLSVLPLRADAPIYLPAEHRPDFGSATQLARVRELKWLPVYRWTLQP
ncbi:beta-galactosidase [Roseateles koreensis]|uniref:Beta-galactosidase n=1 Tax=Roseateles koreensis TaxID=2987526 RepID=A0ABT5KV60_9BURK|nr:beta-galactosidase [Roseateles koreensis]MDC8786827.1 beta-galactosidase [Roseateles koreensis]